MNHDSIKVLVEWTQCEYCARRTQRGQFCSGMCEREARLHDVNGNVRVTPPRLDP